MAIPQPLFRFQPFYDGSRFPEMQVQPPMKTGGVGLLICAKRGEAELTNVVDTFVVSLVHIRRFSHFCEMAAVYSSG
jgi:hypothetical protein